MPLKRRLNTSVSIPAVASGGTLIGYVAPGAGAIVTRNGSALASSAYTVSANGAVNLSGSTLVGGDIYTIAGVATGAPVTVTVPSAPATAPAAPTITLTPGAAQVSVAWTDGATNGAAITSHKLYRGTASGSRALVGTIGTTSPYTDTGLTNGTTYFYSLSAVNSVGEGAQSAEVSTTPVAAGPTLSALTLSPLTATAGSAYSGIITGKTSGSTVTASSSDGTALTVTGSTVTGTFAAAGSPTVTLSEALPSATNTPRSSTASLTISAAAPAFTLGDGSGMSAAGVSMTQLPASRVDQRMTTTGGLANKGTGTHKVTANLTSAVTSVEYRTRDAENNSTSAALQDWTPLTTPSGTGSKTISVTGVSARKGWHYVDLRFNGSNTQVALGTNKVGMGRVIAVSGQSLAVRLINHQDTQSATIASLGLTASPYGVVAAGFEGVTAQPQPYSVPADSTNYDTGFSVDYLNRSIAAAGVNCALVGYAKGGQPISAFLSGGTYNPFLVSALQNAGAFEHAIWLQGHSDGSAGTSYATYQAALTNLFTNIFKPNSSIPFSIATAAYPNIATNSWGTPAQITVINQAMSDWAAAQGTTYGPRVQYLHPVDIDLIDGTHESMAGGVALARHFYRAAAADFGLSINDNGPIIAGATRTNGSKSIVLSTPLPGNGATALTSVGSPATRFSVYPKGLRAAKLALDGTTPIVVGTNTVTLNLAADPGDNVANDILFAYPLDPNATGAADMVYDNSNDGDGLTIGRHIVPTLSAVQTAGNLEPSTYPLIMTSPTYATGESGFAQRLTSGRGSPAQSPLAYRGDVWTMDFRVTGTGTNFSVIGGADNKAFVLMNTAGRVGVQFKNAAGANGNIGDSTSGATGTNPIINDGTPHHIRVVANGPYDATNSPNGGLYLFVDGALAARAMVSPTLAYGDAFGVRAIGNGAYGFSGTVDEVAVFSTAKSIAAFTAPTAPYTSAEPGLVVVWHLDGSGAAVP
ncbi:beta strand repeat-containing protein [Methylobacterium mesophilicum]